MDSDLVPEFQGTENMSRRSYPRLTDDQEMSANPRPAGLPVIDGALLWAIIVVERRVPHHPNVTSLRAVCGVGHALKLGLRSL